MARLLEHAVGWLGRQGQKRVPYSAHNRFLEGPFAPLLIEATETRLTVRGHIPAELNGTLARIGPSPRHIDNPGAYHWFVGDGMVHGLRLRDGQALWFRNRWVGVDSINKALGRPKAPGPRRGIVEPVNTNIIGHGGRFWALVEAGAYPVEMDAEFNTVRHGLFDSALDSGYSAHPHRDPLTGDLHAICYDGLLQNKVRYLVVDKDCRVTRQVDIPVKHGPMIHDCALTRRHVVILDLPVTFSFKAAFGGMALPYTWNPGHEARVGLLPRDGQAKDVRWFSVSPCYVFHTANARDLDDGSVLMDVVVHERMFDRSTQGPENQVVTFERWKLDAATGQVQRTVLSEERQEFPRYDERLTGQPYRYAYTVGIDVDTPQPNALIRHDVETGQVMKHVYGGSWMTAEAVFVPRHADASEDDGWLMSYVHDLNGGNSRVVIVNAGDLEGEPQAIIELPVRVPLGFHGNWIPQPG